jgi:dTDP-4-amino-4,6-dideoxygalactose transaminase
MSLHGISKDAWKRYSAEGSWYYEIIAPGFKYNMTDVASALGIVQLAKCDRMWQRRAQISQRYTEALSEVPEVEVPPVQPHVTHAWHLYIIRLRLEQLVCTRNQFLEELKSRRIGVSVHFIPLHIHPYYKKEFGYEPDDFPVAHGLFQRVISLPIYPGMSDDDVEDVILAIKCIIEKNRR